MKIFELCSNGGMTMPAKNVKPAKKGAAKKSAAKKMTVHKAPLKKAAPRFTYSNLTFSENDHVTYDQAVAQFHGELDHHYQNLVNGVWLAAANGAEMAHASPADTRLTVSHFPKFGREETVEAIRAARLAANEWGRMPYKRRSAIMRRAADLMYERAWQAAAIMAFEVGKPRGEGIAEVYEAAEIIRYYCDAIEASKGFVYTLTSPGKNTRTQSVLLPYGVFGVISPWNFPIALATGMTSAALIAGNTVVQKPASESPVSAYFLAKCLVDAGLPDGVFNLVVGPGSSVGEELRVNPMVDGIAFTGSYDVGMHLYRNFGIQYPKPVIAEMGGKNPVIITENADLDMAAEGTARGAFGFSGQKCSATSRAYVAKAVKGEFIDRLVEYASTRVNVGFPTERATFMGPVMNQSAVDTWQQAVDDALAAGGRIVFGGNRINDGALQHGYYVQPTIVDSLAPDHRLFQDELFVPFLAVQEVDSLEEAMTLANDVQFGLTAGIYSQDQREIDYFYDNIQAGVTYSNRRAGATTGAWPQNNTFGGWKGSGSTGHNAFGPHYLQHFMREQSRWIVNE
ncbi:aldehyde dehydrogenase family protein [Anaerolineae bacterium CFX7]|nr:aldehyde dehydrogenase family protein [Anaerolineae bacterium CFX7]